MELRCSFIFLIYFLQFADSIRDGSQWTWICVNEKCIKMIATNNTEPMSLDICRLFCGNQGSLWPLPTGQIILGRELIMFHPKKIDFDFGDAEVGQGVKDYLLKISKIFYNRMLNTCGFYCTLVPKTEVIIRFIGIFPDLKLDWQTDESYAIDIIKRGKDYTNAVVNNTIVEVNIRSKSVYGARHALETLSQLITSYIPPTARKWQHVLVIISSARITDSPAFPHRGLVLDTARHFIPVEDIRRTLDAMAMTKLNVFHWHVTDSQSFPLETPRVPQLFSYGAYSEDQIYTVQDTKSIIEYAKFRGIRVIIEIDAPAHAGNGWEWGESSNLGKLAVCINQQPWRKYCIQPPCGQLNPVNKNLYRIFKDIFSDILELLPPGETFHMGGDEVFFPCWNSSSEIVEWLQENGYNRTEDTFLQLWSFFQENVLKSFLEVSCKQDTPIILWSSKLTNPDVIEKYLDKDRYIIETWLEATSNIPNQLLEKGYKLIMATKDRWYLDHGFWGNTVYHCWEKAYNNRLPMHENVLGGEAAMWSERVDANSLDIKVWPRTAAVAERLWSNPSTNAREAVSRFEYFRERLVKNGIRADAISPYYCLQNEDECK